MLSQSFFDFLMDFLNQALQTNETQPQPTKWCPATNSKETVDISLAYHEETSPYRE
jgi:hypothetical protein